MRRFDADLVEDYKTRIWEYAELHRADPARYPWKVAPLRRYVGCTLRELLEHKDLNDLFWNVRKILSL